MNQIIKILHAADIQFEVRSHGMGKDRYDEYNIGVSNFSQRVAAEQPDILVIPGDIFEHGAANAEEVKLFTKLLRLCSPHVRRIVVTSGNHDQNRLRHNLVTVRGEKRVQANLIESTIDTMNDPKISYYGVTGFHDDPTFPITWAVWSHDFKCASTSENPLPYSPYETGKPNTTNTVIELFHDPIKSCKGFSGSPNPVFSDYKISLSNFGSDIIIAGDIHSPDIIWFGSNMDRLFTYSSSLIQRNFGEGNEYRNHKLVVNGNEQHGYNIIEVDTERKRAKSCTFNQLPNPFSRHTIRLSKDFNYDLISTLNIHETAVNRIKLAVEGNVHEYIENEEKIYTHLKSKYDCTVETVIEPSAFDVDVDNSLIESVESITDQATILKIAERYIEDAVNKSKTVSPEQKTEAIEFITNKLRKALSSVDTMQAKSEIKLVSAKISNFMSFKPNVQLNFGNRAINKISGSNGLGKTTIFSFILWMITDLISEFQSARNKKYNYSLYFNDSNDDIDVVGDELQFTKNGNLHVLTKKLTRSRKKNGEISGYDVTMSLASPQLTSTDREEIMNYLATEVATFDELNRSMFVNQSTLTNLIKTSTADLNKRILSNIGINFPDKLLGGYEELRADEMSKVEKPLKTVEELIEQKNVQAEELLTKRQELETITASTTPVQNDINDLSSTIERDLARKFQVSSVKDVEQDIQTTESLIKSSEINIETFTEEHAKAVADVEASNIDEVNKRKSDQSLKILKIEGNINLVNEQINSLGKTIESEKKNVQQVAQIVKSELSSSVQELVNKESSLQLEINKHLTVMNDASAEYGRKLTAHSNEISSERSKIKTEELNLDSEISELKGKLSKIDNHRKVLTERKNSKISERDYKSSEDSTKCPTCKQPLPAEELAKITKFIEEINTEINQIDDNIVKLDNKECELQEQVRELTTKKSKLVDEIKVKDNELEQLADVKLDGLNDTADPELWKTWKAAYDLKQQAAEELTIIPSKKEEAQKQVLSGVKSDQRVVDAMATYKEQSEKLPQLEKQLEELNTAHTDETTQLSILEGEVANIEKLKSKANEILEKITKSEENLSSNRYKLSSLQTDLEHAKFNVELQAKIDANKAELETRKTDLQNIQSEIQRVNSEILMLESNSANTELSITNARKYKLIDGSLKLYKRMLGTSGLPQYIFAHIIPLFNKNLNELLEDVDFRLEFSQDDLILYFHDLKKMAKRPVAMFISGMETTFSGLALIDVIRRLNNTKSTKEIFIDEISGQLNSGKDLSYKAKNYQALLVRFIKKISAHSNVYIIDHVLSFNDSRTIEVYPEDRGSAIRVIH